MHRGQDDSHLSPLISLYQVTTDLVITQYFHPTHSQPFFVSTSIAPYSIIICQGTGTGTLLYRQLSAGSSPSRFARSAVPCHQRPLPISFSHTTRHRCRRCAAGKHRVPVEPRGRVHQRQEIREGAMLLAATVVVLVLSRPVLSLPFCTLHFAPTPPFPERLLGLPVNDGEGVG